MRSKSQRRRRKRQRWVRRNHGGGGLRPIRGRPGDFVHGQAYRTNTGLRRKEYVEYTIRDMRWDSKYDSITIPSDGFVSDAFGR